MWQNRRNSNESRCSSSADVSRNAIHDFFALQKMVWKWVKSDSYFNQMNLNRSISERKKITDSYVIKHDNDDTLNRLTATRRNNCNRIISRAVLWLHYCEKAKNKTKRKQFKNVSVNFDFLGICEWVPADYLLRWMRACHVSHFFFFFRFRTQWMGKMCKRSQRKV